jgi:hypothetical protein
MAKSSPFAGIKLSDQTAVTPRGTDQRLFQSPAPKRDMAPVVEQASEPSREVGKQESRGVGREVRLPQSREVGKPPTLFDVNQKGWRKASFEFTDEEFLSLDELKIELQRNYSIISTKEDLARCAFSQLIKDFRKNGESSFLVNNLRRKGKGR